MKKVGLISIALALVIALMSFIGCGAGDGVLDGSELQVNLNSQQEGIWVNGTGKVSAVPDIATLNLGIEAQEATVADAQNIAAEAMAKVKTALTDNGVAEEDIQTQSFYINKISRWDNDEEKEVVTGYRVSNMVTAKIKEIDKVGTVIDAVAIAGGDLTRINGINFSVEDPTVYYNEAREKAVAEAEAKAKQIAELTGTKLGKAVYITENVYTPSPIYRNAYPESMSAAPAAVTTPVSPGELEITLNIQITYAILD